MRYINIPNSNKRIYIGSVVVLERFPDIKWILKSGWYMYENKKYCDWYFYSISEHITLPVDSNDLINIKIISAGEDTYKQNPLYSPCFIHHTNNNTQDSSVGCKSFAVNFKEVFGTDEPIKLDADSYLASLNPPITPHEGIVFINIDETSVTYNVLYIYFRLPETDELVFRNNYTKNESAKFDTIQGIL